MEGTLEIRLENACTNTGCYWHTTHWSNLYRSGCYMLKDITKCKEPLPFKEGLKREHPDMYKKLYGEEG